MSQPRYIWRQLTAGQREELLAWRKERHHPWHSPPHRPNLGHLRFLISAACFEHHSLIGQSPERMEEFSADLLALLAVHAGRTFAWCVLPNHYHALVATPDIKQLLHELGRLHGRTSHAWNWEDAARGRKVFFRAVERAMRFRPAFPGHVELCASQSRAAWLRRTVDGLAVEQRGGIPRTDGHRGSEARLARLSDTGLRERLGCAGDVKGELRMLIR